MKESKLCLQHKEIEKWLISAKGLKGKISYIYAILTYASQSSCGSLKSVWERDLEVTFTLVEWSEVLQRNFNSSVLVMWPYPKILEQHTVVIWKTIFNDSNTVFVQFYLGNYLNADLICLLIMFSFVALKCILLLWSMPTFPLEQIAALMPLEKLTWF